MPWREPRETKMIKVLMRMKRRKITMSPWIRMSLPMRTWLTMELRVRTKSAT